MGDSQVGAELLLGNVFLAMLMLTLMLMNMLKRQHDLTLWLRGKYTASKALIFLRGGFSSHVVIIIHAFPTTSHHTSTGTKFFFS